MNKRINQLINQLHLDPKKEAAVRKIVENAVSNNQNSGNNSGGGGPVIIEMIGESASVTDEQIEAAKNGNIKIKMNTGVEIIYTLPYYYFIKDDSIMICVRLADYDFYDSIFKIDIINKTISPYIKE